MGPDHETTLFAMHRLALLLDGMGQLEEAESLYLRNLECSERALGPEHPSTHQLVCHVAVFLQEIGKLTEAEPFFQRALAGNTKSLGPDHPHTLMTRNSMASLLCEMGKLSEAELLWRRLVEDATRILGAEHPHTQAFAKNLAEFPQDVKDVAAQKGRVGTQLAAWKPSPVTAEVCMALGSRWARDDLSKLSLLPTHLQPLAPAWLKLVASSFTMPSFSLAS